VERSDYQRVQTKLLKIPIVYTLDRASTSQLVWNCIHESSLYEITKHIEVKEASIQEEVQRKKELICTCKILLGIFANK